MNSSIPLDYYYNLTKDDSIVNVKIKDLNNIVVCKDILNLVDNYIYKLEENIYNMLKVKNFYLDVRMVNIIRYVYLLKISFDRLSGLILKNFNLEKSQIEGSLIEFKKKYFIKSGRGYVIKSDEYSKAFANKKLGD